MTHPGTADLALFAGGDLGFRQRCKVGWHVRSCPLCQAEIRAYRAAAGQLREASEVLPAGLNWDRLASEMTANIHVGLEAAECVGPAPSKKIRTGWRAAAAVAAMSILVLAAWVLNPPPGRPDHAVNAAKLEIRNTSSGLEMNENGGALVLLHGRGTPAQRPMIVSSPGSLRARFVDDETGQITINHVYSE
jgi:hypothetical protein